MLICILHSILNACKDFIASYSSKYSDQMIVKYKDKFYKLTIEEIEAPEITDYLRRKYNSNMDDDAIKISELLSK